MNSLYLLGGSTHNQRNEHLWRDLFSGCVGLFYDLFYFMEDQNILDPSCEEHLWCLHRVFLPLLMGTSTPGKMLGSTIQSEPKKTEVYCSYG